MKNRLSLLILTIALCFPDFLYSETHTLHLKSKYSFCLYTVPKAGTHLLFRALNLITGKNKKVIWPPTPLKNSKQVQSRYLKFDANNTFELGHIPFTKLEESLLRQNGILVFTILRDPRDLLISTINWIDKGNIIKNKSVRRQWEKKSFTQKVKYVLSDIKPFWTTNPTYKELSGLAATYMLRYPWAISNIACCVKYEDLVGSKGGGSDVLQRQALKKILFHLDVPITEDTISYISNNLYGWGPTYHSGRIHRWKTALNKHEIDLCRKYLSDLLILTGYEKDKDW